MDRRLRRAAAAAGLGISLFAAACENTDSEASRPAALDLVPANAAAYTEARIDPSDAQQSALEEVARRFPREARAEVVDRLTSLFDDSMPPLDVDFADVEPWLGATAAEFEVTEVVDDFHVYLFAVEEGAEERARGVFTEEMEDTSEESYNGIDYVSGRGFDGATYEVGVLEGFLVVATEGGFAPTVDASVSESLETVPEFQEAVGTVEGDALGMFYLDVRSLQNEPTLEDQMTQEEFRAAGLLGNGVIAGSLSVRDDAVVVEVSSGFDAGGHLAPVLRGYRREETLSELPGHAWLAARVPNVKAVVRGVMNLTGVKQKPAWRGFKRQLKRAGINFRKDFLSWMRDGTVYVGGRFPALDIGLSIESSNAAKTASFVRRLSLLLRSGGVRISRLPSFAGHADFDVHLPWLPQPVHVYGARAFTVAYGRTLDQVHRAEGFLDASDDFESAMDALGDDYGVTLFVDGDQARQFAEGTVQVTEGLLPKAYADDVQPLLAQGDYLIQGVAVDEDRILQQIVIGVR